MYPTAIQTGENEFELSFPSMVELNAAMAKLIAGGVLLAEVVPARSVLEQQFREAVGETG